MLSKMKKPNNVRTKNVQIFPATYEEVEKAKTGKACSWCCELGRKIHKTTDHVCLRCDNVRKAYAKSLKGEVAIVYKLF
jgi:hypothetical protein